MNIKYCVTYNTETFYTLYILHFMTFGNLQKSLKSMHKAINTLQVEYERHLS